MSLLLMNKNEREILLCSLWSAEVFNFLCNFLDSWCARSVSSSSFSISLQLKTIRKTNVICSSNSSPTVLLTLCKFSRALSSLSRAWFCRSSSTYFVIITPTAYTCCSISLCIVSKKDFVEFHSHLTFTFYNYGRRR